MVEVIEQNPDIWEKLFPDKNQREAAINFISDISSLERLEKVIFLKLPNGGQKFYVFFPNYHLTAEEMEHLGSSLDESFAGIEDPHMWLTPIEMIDGEYKLMQESDSEIRAASEYVLWEKAKGRISA